MECTTIIALGVCMCFACIGFAFGYSFCRWRKWKKVFPSIMLIDLDKGQTGRVQAVEAIGVAAIDQDR